MGEPRDRNPEPGPETTPPPPSYSEPPPGFAPPPGLTPSNRPNHLLHLILTLITCGAWSPVWIVLTARYWHVVDYRDPAEYYNMVRRTAFATILVLFLLVNLAGVIFALGVGITDDLGGSSTGDPSASPPGAPVTKGDYVVVVKTLSKKCSGVTACDVDVRLLVSGTPVTDGVQVALTITVTGDEKGPTIDVISLDKDGHYTSPEVRLSTPRSSTIVKAKITELEITGRSALQEPSLDHAQAGSI